MKHSRTVESDDSTKPISDVAAPKHGSEETGATEPVRAESEIVERKEALPTAKASGLSGTWVWLVLGALITILLLVFVMQNNDSVQVQYFAWKFSLPKGVLVLFAAIAGALIMALFAGFRILQLRLRTHRARKALSARR